MTLAQYLEDNRHEAAQWPGGEATGRMLSLFLQGFPVARLGGAAREVLLHCYAVLSDLVHKAPDAELRAEAAWCLAKVATALRTISEEGP